MAELRNDIVAYDAMRLDLESSSQSFPRHVTKLSFAASQKAFSLPQPCNARCHAAESIRCDFRWTVAKLLWPGLDGGRRSSYANRPWLITPSSCGASASARSRSWLDTHRPLPAGSSAVS